jgi:hypothetical protein
MKRILFAGLVALAAVGLSEAPASAICFDIYKPCVRIPLPRLPIFLPKICIGCDPEGKQNGCGFNNCGSSNMLFNRSFCYGGGAYGNGGGCASCGKGGCGHGGCGGRFPCGNWDCNRPLYPNPGYGYMCYDGPVGPWYGYFPPPQPTGYQVGGYGAFRGPVAGPGYAPAAPTGATSMAYNNVPSYWYGR